MDVTSSFLSLQPSSNSGSVLTKRPGGSLASLSPKTLLTAEMMARAIGDAHPKDEGFSAASRAAYQGVPGAYSEAAVLKACPGWDPMPCEQFETAFQALTQVGNWQTKRERNSLCSIHAFATNWHLCVNALTRTRLRINLSTYKYTRCILCCSGWLTARCCP
jgi:hypothetical protein